MGLNLAVLTAIRDQSVEWDTIREQQKLSQLCQEMLPELEVLVAQDAAAVQRTTE